MILGNAVFYLHQGDYKLAKQLRKGGGKSGPQKTGFRAWGGKGTEFRAVAVVGDGLDLNVDHLGFRN